jgi:dienelactone hydrolase
VLFGFSQGACLAAEVFARTEAPLAGLVAPAGARIGAPGEQSPVRRDLSGAFAVLGVAEEDPWLVAADVDATAAALRAAGATVHVVGSRGDAHVVTGLQRLVAREALRTTEPPPPLRGFGNTFESEALPGALPRHQNTPRPAPYGLFGEHVSGTGFTATRAENR